MTGRRGRSGDPRGLEELRLRAEEYLEALKHKGCRRTEQRRLIIETLLESQGEHLNARQIMERVQAKDPSVGFATVYRTLVVLEEMGLVHSFDRGEGFARFHIPDGDIHVHVTCRVCGNTVHLEDREDLQGTIASWIRGGGLAPTPQTVQLYGVCPTCEEEPTKPAGYHMTCCGRRRRGMPG
ncbi:Fe2+/Zn2+ uptake regulation protein [Thermanaerovibrio velox DSM 12556]|uniref:Fe2+/Zn2+ uptake regulation protein n=1 Tax=Thermanaerovibrio velox DSM 12556 TaxID=926567 RepID=H0UMS0_9BACT|nr:Fur family transcriptional regulator [Thermanaerovibrio velox]EHM09215.1 Fe2+/Zn2+ uptake regulation protein [Thermanaerovibrio velox DSM 12556]